MNYFVFLTFPDEEIDHYPVVCKHIDDIKIEDSMIVLTSNLYGEVKFPLGQVWKILASEDESFLDLEGVFNSPEDK